MTIQDMIDAGMYDRLTDVRADESVFVRNGEPSIEYRCKQGGCPTIQLSVNGHSSMWGTPDNVQRYCRRVEQ